ncbi:MAG: 2-oxoacid:acceptor oxidoreductase family protein [Candidatus Woesearchaeota archaeon]|nr:2-oxoacid:acceptor oxidoreductase family protein [Candidatus Woesearchaeota archaeon]
MKEIIIYGRGGQGAVTAAHLLAISAFYDGKESQAFPNFGVERRGAPVQAYCRISDSKINLRSQIYHPDYAVVLDPSLLPLVDLKSLAERKGTLIINTNKKAGELCLLADRETIGEIKILTFDASSIALEVFKSDIVNTAMVAVFASLTKEISEESMVKGLYEIFERKDILKKNIDAIQKICSACRLHE